MIDQPASSDFSTEYQIPVEPPKTLPTVVKPKPSPLRLPFLLLLLVLTIGLYMYNRSVMSPTPNDTITALPTPAAFFLTLDGVNKITTAVDGETLVTGKTVASATVAIFSDEDETIVESDAEGKFEGTVVVGEEGGLIRVVAYGNDGQERSETVDLTKVSVVLGKTDTQVNQGKKTIKLVPDTANSKKPNIDETVSIAPLEPQTLGNGKVKTATESAAVTGKAPNKTATESAAQVKARQTKVIKAVADFVANKAAVKKLAKLGPEKMLDLLAQESTGSAIRAKNGMVAKMEVREATAGAQLQRQAIEGVISNLANGTITLTHQTQSNRVSTVYVNNSTVVTIKGLDNPTPTQLTVGMRVVAVGQATEIGLMANKIHVIPGKAVGLANRQPVGTGSAVPPATASPTPTASQSAFPSAVPTASPSAEPSASASANLSLEE